MNIGTIAKRWRLLSGQDNWKNLLDPLDIDLRRYIIHYGQLAQATYDNFNSERISKYAGDSLYSKKNLFSRVGLTIANPFKYRPVKYFYATSDIQLPESYLLKSLSKEAWTRETNWMGYIAVATNEGKAVLGRRDIVVAWRGTIQILEWAEDFVFPLVSASKILREANDPKVHEGWLALYTSKNPKSLYSQKSARQQVIEELKRLIKLYKGEEISITVTGHSLGGALAIMNAGDIVANEIHKDKEQPKKQCPVTVFAFANPRVGDSNFQKVLESMKDLHLLRINNIPDVVPDLPLKLNGYTDVGVPLVIDTRWSNYLKSYGDVKGWHNLEAYLHGVAGTQGNNQDFHLEVKRDIALVNKDLDALKKEYLVPTSWWSIGNKGMVQQEDGSWKLEDHEGSEDL